LFYCYVLRSERTGRRYVGACKDLADLLYRHNSGQSPATKSGVPWRVIHTEGFTTRTEALARERYYKTGHGRDELDRLPERGRLGDRSEVQILSPRLAVPPISGISLCQAT
jgi:putative endonuclease